MYNNTEINDAGYLSSHQSSDNYYNKSENDNAGYLTSHHGKPVCSSVQGQMQNGLGTDSSQFIVTGHSGPAPQACTRFAHAKTSQRTLTGTQTQTQAQTQTQTQAQAQTQTQTQAQKQCGIGTLIFDLSVQSTIPDHRASKRSSSSSEFDGWFVIRYS